jgi:hypothetical protein
VSELGKPVNGVTAKIERITGCFRLIGLAAGHFVLGIFVTSFLAQKVPRLLLWTMTRSTLE